MAINQEIISTSWEGQQKSYIEAGLKTLLQRMLEALESPLAANSVGSNQLTQELREVINSIGSKVPNTRTVNSKPLSADVTIGPDDIMVDNQTLSAVLEDIGQGGDTIGLAQRVAALEQSLNNLTGTEDTTQIIDTFNEVIDFLENVYNDETLVGKLQQLQTQINSKANDNAVVKGIKANGASTTLPVDSNGIVTLPPAGSTISPATAAPIMDGTAGVGSSAKYAREDHVHPHDTSKQDTLTNSTTLMTINGNAVHYGESVTVQGEKGEQGETGHVQVDGNGNVLIYNGRDKTTTGAALDAYQGQFLGKMLNAKDNTFYNVWVGTEAELEALDGDYEDNTIYLVGTVPAIAQKFNVNFNGGSHTSIPANTPHTVTEGSSFSVVVSPASGYTIDTATGSMVGGTLAKLINQDGTVTFSTSAVTGAITITAAATKHITGITVSAGTRSGNSIPLTAVVAPSGAENVTLAWSVNDTTNFGISGSGASATLTVKSGASNASVVITCADTNAASGTKSGTLQLTGITYVNIVPITALGSVTYAAGQATNTYQFSVEVTPSGGNTPAIEWSVVPTPSGTATISATGLLTITDDCTVVVTATAGQYSASSSATSLTYAVDPNTPIQFADSTVKQLLLSAGYGSNGEITYNQAAETVGNQTSQQAIFKDNTSITSFDEWQYFTNSQFNVSGCTSLTSVTLPKVSGLVNFDSRFGLGGSHGITGTVIIPEGYTKYGAAAGTAFSGNPIAGSGITKVVFPSTFTTFEKPVTSLPYVTELDLTNTSLNSSGLIVNSVKGDSSAMPRLATIKLPNSLTSITTQKPFRQLAALTRIEFGNAFTSGVLLFDDYAFMTAVAMTYVFNSTTPPTAFNFASNQNGKRTVNKILVPRSAVDTYKGSSVFSSYVDKISAIEDEE